MEETKRETNPQRYRQVAKQSFPTYYQASDWIIARIKGLGRVSKIDPRESGDGGHRARVRRRANGYDAILYRRIEEKKEEKSA